MKVKTPVLSLMLFILCTTIVSADGAFFSDYYEHMFEPSQKAVILWNGSTENLVLSTKVPFEQINNFAWVIPIKSSTKPEVYEGNMSIFYDLVDLFMPSYDNWFGKSGVAGEQAGGVTVIEEKEIGIYDITILKATDTDDLIDWLNDHDYLVPAEARQVIDYYISEDCYFILNKVDLRNEYAAEIDFLDSLPIKEELSDDQLEEYYLRASNEIFHDVYYDNIARHILQNISYEEIVESYEWTKMVLVTKQEYEELLDEYAVKGIMDREDFEKQDEIISRLEQISNQYNYDQEKMLEFSQTLSDMRMGMATPIEIEFTPDQPFYPLEISSLAQGETIIDVYVIADYYVLDANSILEFDSKKKLSYDMMQDFTEYTNAEDVGRKVTRLTFEGNLADLSDDAMFEPKPTTFWEQMYEQFFGKIFDLFGGLFRFLFEG